MKHPKLFSLLFAISMLVHSVNGAEKQTYVETPVQADYLKKGTKEYKLVFYGYVGCIKICSPVLDNLAKFYASDAFSPYREHVDPVFVNLMPELSKEQPELFAKSFNRDFHGVYLDEKQLTSLDKELSVFFTRKTGDEFDIDHSDFVYLLRQTKKGDLRLINIYHTHPLQSEMILKDLSVALSFTDQD